MDVVTFGETMALFTPNTPGPLDVVTEFRKGMAGAESNVAIGLARLGHSVGWVSKLGDDRFGRYIYKTLRGEGVDVSHVTFDRDYPTGVFFKERQADGRVTVYYYRHGSAASQMVPDDISVHRLGDVKYLVVTGITPALSDTNRQTVLEVVSVARQQGIQVVFDPNIRLKLWSMAEAAPVLCEIASRSNVVLPGIDEGKLLTGSSDPEVIAQFFLDKGAELVVVKLGPEGAYYQSLSDKGYVPGFAVTAVDEVGAGDAFTAGVLSGLLEQVSVCEAVKRACAMGALAVTGIGDYECLPYREDLERFIQGTSEVRR